MLAAGGEVPRDFIVLLVAAWMLRTQEKLFLAPVPRPKKVLDLGTGTGKWAEYMGEEHPQVEIIGTDLSPIQTIWVLANVRFEIDNAGESWTWKENTFDLIHSSQMPSGCISDVPHYFRQAFRCCAPDGYFEIHDLQMNISRQGNPIPDGAGMRNWCEYMCQGIAQFESEGRRFNHNLDNVIRMMRGAGFVYIECQHFRVPLGSWPKDLTLKNVGRYQLAAMLCGIKGLTFAPLIQGLGWKVLLAEARNDAPKKGQHYYFNGYAVWGRKAPAAAGS